MPTTPMTLGNRTRGPCLLLIALVATATTAGCGDDGSPGTEAMAPRANANGDGDGDSLSDQSDSPDTSDSEDVWNPPDAGERDNPDLTAQDPEDRMCAPILVNLGQRDEPSCSAETGRCVVACADADDGEACRDACATMDTYDGSTEVECGTCLTVRSLQCFADRGCSTNRLFCCIDDKCGGVGGPEGCVDAMCVQELQTLTACVTSTPAALGCFDFADGPVASCFAPPLDDGDADAGAGE